MTDNKELAVANTFSIQIASIQDKKDGTGPVNEEHRRLLGEKKQLEDLRARQSIPKYIAVLDKSLAAVQKNIDDLTSPPRLITSKETSDSIKAYLQLNQQYRDCRDQLADITAQHGKESAQAKEATLEMAGYRRFLEPIQAAINKTGRLPEPLAGSQANIPGTSLLVIQINDQLVSLPCSVHQITLTQRIDYGLLYGNELHFRLKVIQALQEEQEREIALAMWQQARMFKEIAFFTSIPLEVLQDSGMDQSIQNLYNASLSGLIDYE